MKSVNATCAKEGYPILVQHSDALGNHAIAARDISRGECILKALPYAAEAFDNYRKRMCHTCLLYHTRSTFKYRCQDCDQVYYCSEICKTIGMDPTSGCHPKLCRALRRLATWDSDRHTKSIIKLYLQVLLSHWRERQGLSTPYERHQQAHMEKQLREQEEAAKGAGTPDDLKESSETREVMACATVDTVAGDKEQEVLPKNFNVQLSISSAQAPTNDSIQNSSLSSAMTSAMPSEQLQLQQQLSPQQQQQQRQLVPIENTFEDVRRLQSHVEDWDEEEHQDWAKQSQVVLSLLEMAGLTEMMVDAKTKEVCQITAEDIKYTVSALESNCFGMFDRSRKKHVCFGRASFFNHSCECNATAVQADGAEEVTGDDVLGVIAYEEANKEAAATAASTTGSRITSGSTDSSALDSKKVEDSDGTTTPNTESEDQTEKEEENPKDPYEDMVGKFRAISFFAMKNIPEGKDVTISYIDSDMPLQARRLALRSDYHFHCCCERCMREEVAQKSTKAKVSKSSKKIAGSKAAKKSKK
ncbi:hypothetical protein BGW41_003427 [Actinomortierella wolfii]|nr:hypothetical protein BGW41_003427 [Actinomortierella wolfii]